MNECIHNQPEYNEGYVLDGVSSTKTDPLWNWTILLHLLGKNLLGTESFMGWLINRNAHYDDPLVNCAWGYTHVERLTFVYHLLFFPDQTALDWSLKID